MMTLPSAMLPLEAAKSDKTVDCPLCGFRFGTREAACSGCAMFHGCSMLKCPNCHYEFVTESKIINWFKKIFQKRRMP